MGREWIVFPSHNHVVSLESRAYDSPYADDVDDGEGEELSLGGFDGLCKKSCCSEVNLMFSISPTLGLVSLPVAVDFGGLLFMEWVGPRPDRTKAVVKLAERLGLATPWCCSRRWAAAVPEDSQEFGMTLWNFDRIEAEMAASVAGGDGACGIAKVGGIALPGGDISMAIGESSTLECDSMLLRSGHVDGLMLTVDMPATLAQRKMVARESTLPIIKHMWRQMFWEGKAYATLKDRTLVCLTTGKQTDLGIDAFLQHIGGPLYVLKRDCYPKVWEVYSLKDPGKLLYKHAVARHGTSAVGKGLLVEEPGEYSDPNLIKVIDAASGTVIFTITNKCKYYVSTVS
ncbi:hypothetical protein Pelo_3834 [Pelomyxa schiedti]|nr:hypothetical protein Pelo_3834 [Pelomyxa schiedti]